MLKGFILLLIFESGANTKASAAAVGYLPPGWDSVTLIAPCELIVKFRDEISKATKKLAKQANTQAKMKKDKSL